MRDITAYCLKTLNIPVYYANSRTSSHTLYGNIISVETLLEGYKKEDVLILFAVAKCARWEAEDLYQKGITKIYSVRKLWGDFILFEWDDYKKRLYRNISMVNVVLCNI